MCAVGLCLLMQKWSDHCVSLSVCLIHQSVQIGREGVADVQDMLGYTSELSETKNNVKNITCLKMK